MAASCRRFQLRGGFSGSKRVQSVAALANCPDQDAGFQRRFFAIRRARLSHRYGGSSIHQRLSRIGFERDWGPGEGQRGNLHVAGLTSQELQDLVTSKLRDGYLKKPSINVSIDSYRLYYIKGEVTRPGGYTFVDGLTVAKAVALAGGYTVRASESSITLVRESDPENPLDSVGVNSAIQPGDIITVGESFF